MQRRKQIIRNSIILIIAIVFITVTGAVFFMQTKDNQVMDLAKVDEPRNKPIN